MGTDVGYLQNKLKELQDRIKEQDKKIEFLQSNNKINFVEEAVKKISAENNKFKVSFLENVEEKIQRMYNQHLREKNQEVYDQLHNVIGHELKFQRKGNKDFILKFIQEVVYQRKDLGNLISIMVSKGICSEEEVHKMDKKQLKCIDDLNIKQQIWEQFYPKLLKGDKCTAEEILGSDAVSEVSE